MESPAFKEENKETNLLDTDIADKYWYELRVDGLQPDRRAYHSQFLHGDQLYIFGGKDIREVQLSSLWCFDLSRVG